MPGVTDTTTSRRSAARLMVRNGRLPAATSMLPAPSATTPKRAPGRRGRPAVAGLGVGGRGLRVVARRIRRRDEAGADADRGDADARRGEPPRIAPPLGRRRRRRRQRLRRLDDDDVRVVGQVLRAAAQRHLRRVRLHRRRVRRQETLIQRDRALAVARQPLRLALGEQELAPRFDRRSRLRSRRSRRRSRGRRSVRGRACTAPAPPGASDPRRYVGERARAGAAGAKVSPGRRARRACPPTAGTTPRAQPAFATRASRPQSRPRGRSRALRGRTVSMAASAG